MTTPRENEPIIIQRKVELLVKESAESIEEKEFEVSSYSSLCEEDSKIQKVVPLYRSNYKFALFIFLNICTVCIIDLFISWFPVLNLYLLYTVTTLDKATHLAVYNLKGRLTVTELMKKKKPQINFEDEKYKNSVIKHFNLNINYDTPGEIIMFNHRLFDYVFNFQRKSFENLDFKVKTNQDEFQNNFTTGLFETEIEHMRDLFGICDIDIKIHSVFQILLNELTDPFYLFQLYSVILWYCNNYASYATVIIILTILSLIVSVWETRRNLVSLHEMSKYSCEVNVYRPDAQGVLSAQKMSSTNLVPGDLYEIPDDGLAMPCDTILVKGTVIINESMLTGESTPIVKNRMPSVEGVLFDTTDPNSEKFFLFAGTKVVQKRSLPNFKVLGVVYSTGFQTTKGNLIRQIMFPKDNDEKFRSDSGKYILFMAVLCIVGFAISLKFLIDNAGLTTTDVVLKFLDLVTTTVPPSLPACISVGITYSTSRLKKAKILCIARERVNVAGKVNIICFDKTGTLTEDHLDIAGYVPVKTTKDEFMFEKFKQNSSEYSIPVFDHYKTKNLNPNYHDKNKDIKQLYVECLACCHGITFVKDRLIGDPIDVKMFEGIGWQLRENNATNGEQGDNNYDPLISSYVRPKEEQDLNVKLSKLKENETEEQVIKTHYEIGIVRRFDFSSKLQRMTTIGKNINEDYFKAFCKGSPEKIKELCKPGTIPKDFNEVLSTYTSKGFRVLAMATKSIKMSFTQSQQVSREFVESNMIFLGLLIVRNKLKEMTPPTIEELDKADIRMVMATGDNILTAIAVSRECKLVNPNSIIYSCNIEKDNNGKEILLWNKVESYNNDQQGVVTEIDDEPVPLAERKFSTQSNYACAFIDAYPAEEFKGQVEGSTLVKSKGVSNNVSLINKGSLDNSQDSEKIDMVKEKTGHSVDVSLNIQYETSMEREEDYVIALTGATFEKLHKLNQTYIKEKNPKLLLHHITFREVLKNGVVFARMAPEHKALLVQSFKDEKFTVLMCGDGANDCSALRAADVGVSLSPEEASIAAHFTSKVPDISCIVKLLKEGKCSLTTSIQTFKYMMLYSIIQFIAVTLLMVFGSYLSDFQFLASDLFIIFPLALFIAGTAPYQILTHHYPNSSLLSFPVMSSIILQTIITFVFQYVGRVVLAETNPDAVSEKECVVEGDDVFECPDNSIFFLISNMQYLTTAIAFSVSKPFRKPIYTNILLMVYLLLVFFYSIWITINCDSWSLSLFTLHEFQKPKFKYYLFAVICVNFVVSIFTEWVIVGFIENCWENITTKSYKKKITSYDEKSQVGTEYSIYEYQRLYYAERRKKMNAKK